MNKRIKTNLNTEIEKLLKRRGMKWTHLISKGVFAAQVDAWKSGKRTTVSAEHQQILVRLLCRTEVERGEFLKAILEDRRHGPGSKVVEITVRAGYRHHPFNPTA